MKKILIAAMLLTAMTLLFGGCSSTSVSKEQNTKDKEVLSQLNAMAEQDKKPKEMFEYLNQNIKEMNKKDASEAAGLLVDTLEKYATIYSDQLMTGNTLDLLYKYFEYSFDYSKIESIQEPELKTLMYDITLGGFKLVETEGAFIVIVDYSALKTFREYLDDELKAYIDIMAWANNGPATYDAEFAVTSLEQEQNIISMESFIKTYNNQQRKEMVLNMYLGTMMLYMSGTDVAPVFDIDTGTINAEMFKTFETAVAKYKTSVFGKVMSKYVELLQLEGFVNSEKVQDFIFNIDIIVNEELAKAQV